MFTPHEPDHRVTRHRARRNAVLTVLTVVALLLVAVPQDRLSAAAGAASSRIAFSVGDQFPGGDVTFPSDIATVRPDGTDVRQLTHMPAGTTAAMPAYSRDGRRIAYQANPSGRYQIWTMGAAGDSQRQLFTDASFEDFSPTWSPDGSRIAFSRCDEPYGFISACDLAVIDADGTHLRVLLGGHRFHVMPSFSPDGSTIAFASDRDGLHSAIWTVRADGSGLRRVTDANLEAFWPRWTADGTRILLTDNCCRSHSNVWSVAPDGGHLQRITDSMSTSNEGFASPAPTGTAFAFESDTADPCCTELLLRHSDGSTTTVLGPQPSLVVSSWGPDTTSGAGALKTPAGLATTSRPPAPHVAHASAWNVKANGPDGIAAGPVARAVRRPSIAAAPRTATDVRGDGRIAFLDFQQHQIFTISASGGDLRQLTHFDDAHQVAGVAWSPDGRQIAFSLGDVQHNDSDRRVWIMDADGSNAHSVPGETLGYRDYLPQLTRDGRIVFSRCQPFGDGVCTIWIMNRDGTHRRAITPVRDGSDDAIDFWPALSHDGTRVVFTRFDWHGVTAQLWVASIDGAVNEHAITAPGLEGIFASWSPDDKNIVFNSNAAHLGSDIYATEADGAALRQLTTTAYPNNDTTASYAPTGDRIAFASDRRYTDFCCQDMFAMSATGADQQQIDSGGAAGVTFVAWRPTLAP